MPITYGQHTARIKTQYRINKTDIEPGMVLIIRYKPKDNKSFKQGSRLILCLNPEWPKAGTSKTIHAINLADAGYSDLIRAAQDLGLEPSKFQIPKKPLIEKYDSDVQKPRQFYVSKVRNNSIDKYNWGGMYRTYLHKNITSIKLVDYDWPEYLLKKFGITK